MSFSEIRARAGSDIQIDTINELIQQANMSEAIEEQITISDKISPITILRDKLTVTDVGMMTCRVKPRNDSFVSFMPFEPDGKYVRMDLKFDSGGEYLTDYSYMQNIVDLGYDTRQSVLIKGSSDDGVTAGKISAILDGVQHYYKAKITPKNSIKQMVTDGFPGFSFVYRCYPLSILNMQRSINTQRAVPVDFIENESVQYAVRVEIDDNGRVFFYVRHNYQDYYLSTTTKMVDIASNIPNYFSPDYDMDDYDASTEQFQVIYPVSYVDIGFTFNFATKQMQIYKNGVIAAESTPLPAIPALANLSLWLPMSDGQGSIVRDISGTNNNGTFAANLAGDKPVWTTLFDRRLLTFDLSDHVKIPFHANLDTLTSFTCSFFMYPNADYKDPTSNWKAIVGKKYSPFNNGAWRLFGWQATSGNLNYEVKNNSGTLASVTATNGIHTLERWYHVVMTYDGANIRMYIDGVQVGSTSPLTGTLVFATDMFIGSGLNNWTDTARMKIAHVMFWKNTALNISQINDLLFALQPSITPVPYTDESIPPGFIPPQEQDLSFWLPMNEPALVEVARDISGNNNHSNYTSNVSTRKPIKTTINGKPRLEFGTGGDYIPIVKNSTLNPLSGFTVSFFAYLYSDFYSIATSKILFGTGFSISPGSILIYNASGNVRSLNMDVRNDAGASRFLNSGGSLLPNVDNWAHIVVTYDGLAYKFYINGVQTPTVGNFAGDIFTNTSNAFIGTLGTTTFGHEAMAHAMFWKDRALTLAEINEIYNAIMPTLQQPQNADPDILNNAPVFPPGYDEPPAPPPPGTPFQEPFEKIYDNTVIVSPTITEGKKINKITVSDQTSIYNVVKGTEVADPYVPVYDVPHGIQTDTTTTTPVNTVYNAVGTSSHGAIDGGKVFYGQRIKTTSSSYYNKPVTEINCWLTRNAVTGVCKIGILKNDGTFIQFGTDVAATSITLADQLVTRTNYTHGHVMAVGDAFGVFMSDDEGLGIQRANTVDGTNSCQSRHDGATGIDGWQDNPSFHMAALVKDGGIVTGAVVNPWVELQNVAGARYQSGNLFTTGAGNLNKKIHKIELCVWRDATIGPGTPTIQLLHLTSANAIKSPGGTLLSVNISTLPTTRPATFNFTWENPLYDNAILVNERIVVQVTGLTTGKVYIEYNNGANVGAQNHDTNKSYLTYRAVTGGAWGTSTTMDTSGKMYTGGNDFIPYIRLDHTRRRVGIKCATINSDIIGQKITKVAVPANADGDPIDAAIYCRIRNAAGDLKATIGQVDSSGIADTDTTIEFLNTGNNYIMALNDLVSIEYDQGTATDFIKIGIDKNMFDTADTILFEALTANPNSALSVTDRDLAAQLWIGGQVDPIARPARGFKINNNSVAMGEPITEVRARFKRTGTFAGTDKVTCKIIRWSTKGTVITLGEKLCNDISTSAFVEYVFQNTNNAYPMEVGDLISFECNFGNSVTQFIEIQVSTPTSQDHAGNKDGIFTAMFEYNGQTYDDDLLRDVVGSLWIGGFMVFPDPSIPIPPDPYHHYHGWHFSASLPNDSGGIIEPDLLKPKTNSYFNNISDQLRLYSKILTANQFLNYYQNRWTITGIGFGHIEVVGWDFVPYDAAL